MWLLRCDNGERVFYLQNKSEVFVGRSCEVCDLVLTNDASVSRKHLKISIQADHLTCQDLGSKYGTFINSGIDTVTSIGKGINVDIFHLDKIRFGIIGNVWTVEKICLVTCVSTIKGDSLEHVKKDVQHIGAELKNVWSYDCSHLTMPAITLTPKVVLALANGSDIVTPHFWKACKEAIEKEKPLPDSNNFLPDIHETSLNQERISFNPNKARKTILLNLKFIFFSRRQMNNFKDIVAAAGGSFALLSECKMTKSKLCQGNVVVVQYSGDHLTQNSQAQLTQITDIVNYLKTKSKRVIPESEIGLCILYSSTDKYCNPDFNFPTEILKKQFETVSQNADCANVLAAETEDMFPMTPKNIVKTEEVIEESLISNTTLESKVLEDKKVINNNPVFIEPLLNPKRKFTPEIDSGESMHSNSKQAKIQVISDEYDDMFAFIEENPSPNITASTLQPIVQLQKKLNLSILTKPTNLHKYKDEDEDNMFNFIEPVEKPKSTTSISKNSSHSLANIHKIISTSLSKRQFSETELPSSKKLRLSESINDKSILKKSAMMDSIWKSSHIELDIIKKENADANYDIENRLKEMDIKEALVVSRIDLIVREKSETIVMDSSLKVTTKKNFKKFKKVLPLKVQTTTIPKSAMAVYKVVNKLETVDLLNQICDPYDSNDEDRVNNMGMLKKDMGKRRR